MRRQTRIDPNAFKRCHPDLTFIHERSSEVEGCHLQSRQAAAGGGRMEAMVVKQPSIHSDLLSLQQHSSEVEEGCRLQPRQASAGGGRIEAVVEPSIHSDYPFRFPCYIGIYADLKEKLQFGQADGGFECPITFEEFVNDMEIVILPCGHAFSVDGMSDWYEDHENCPSCNGKLP